MSGAVAPGEDLLSMEMGARGVKPADEPVEMHNRMLADEENITPKQQASVPSKDDMQKVCQI